MYASFPRFSSLALSGVAAFGVACQHPDATASRVDRVELQLVACDSSAEQIRACASVAGVLRTIGSTQSCLPAEKPLCWSQVGPKGSSSLAVVSNLPVGDPTCAAGGSRLSVGLDANGNGKLDASEVAGTTVVCNGATGATGPQGAPGQNGSACSVVDNGDGTKTITCGDGTSVKLTDGATGATGPVGAQPSAGGGHNSLVWVTAEPSGNHCASGGVRIQTGLDANDDDLLSETEATQTQYVCNSLVECIVVGAKQCAGSTPQICSSAGKWIDQAACSGETPFCLSGVCGCTKGDLKCSGNSVEVCSATGTWQFQMTCTGTTPYCAAGLKQCTSCQPGARQCSSVDVNTVQVCNAVGTWQNEELCSGATPNCATGQCVALPPGARHCAGNTPQVLSNDGLWKDLPACSGDTPTCFAGDGACHCEPYSCSVVGPWETCCYLDATGTPFLMTSELPEI